MILIETVGVGQSETLVHSMVDYFLLLMLAGAGDDLQGIKRGIMEMADALVVTKADGENVTKAKLARAQYASALHLFPPKENDWQVPSLFTSSTENKGLQEVWDSINHYFSKYTTEGLIKKNRCAQELQLMNQYIGELWLEKMKLHPSFSKHHKRLSEKISSGELSGYIAAEDLLLKITNN